MLEIHAILAPTDFSKHAAAGLRYAVGLAEKMGATLHLIHVLSEPTSVSPDLMIPPALPPDYYQEIEADSLEALEGVLDPAWGKPYKVVRATLWGDPVGEIVHYAKANAIDLISIATHGRTGLGHVLLGSVAERIVREAPCPVLTVRDRTV
jgi:universal stress protein A